MYGTFYQPVALKSLQMFLIKNNLVLFIISQENKNEKWFLLFRIYYLYCI